MKLLSTMRTTLAAAALSATVATGAHAQHAAADVLFDKGYELKQAGNYEEAAQKFYESNEIDPAPGTLLNLAECYIQLGRTASAWSTFRSAAALAAGRGQDQRVAFAEAQVALLEKRLSTITVEVPPEHRTPGLVVMRDGEPISSELYGQAIPIDPGTTKFEATAPGREKWTLEVTVAGDRASRTVLIPLLGQAASGPPAPSPRAEMRPEPTARLTPPATAPPSEDAPSGGAPRWLGWAAVGVGAGAVLTGAVVYGVGRGTVADANCPDEVCVRGAGDPEMYDSGRTQEMIGVAVGGAGLAIAATGVVMLLTSSSEPSDDVAFAAAPIAGGAAVAARGRF